MAVSRDNPYSQFNFTVEIENGPGAGTTAAGFQEVSGLGLEITVAEYRNGNDKTNSVRKITGMYKVPDVTLKRGVIGELATLHTWSGQVRDGSPNAERRVKIALLSEERIPVQTWILGGARPIKYTGPSLNAKGTDVAVEELVLACTSIAFE